MGNADDKFEELIWYYARVHSYLQHLGFSREDARDLAQETFVRVYRQLHEYRGDARWSYLETIARRIALNALRERKAAKRNVSEHSIDDPSDPGGAEALNLPGEMDPYERLLDQELKDLLARAIADLPIQLQETIRLFLAGHDYSDIARMMGVPPSTVKSRLHEARKQIRAIIPEHLLP